VVTGHAKPGAQPVTLAQAHELMPRLMPAPAAPRKEWLAFRRRSAAIYRQVADLDRGHHHEALYWAELETAAADELAAQLAPTTGPDTDQTSGRNGAGDG
jgi:hypothetical protein